MDSFLPFGSRGFLFMLAILVFSRAMDILSTWAATPNLVLEGNPIAKMLGWRWGIPVNLLFCITLAFWPLPAIVLSTTSVLVAARNFHSAWLMRSMGEERYREWHLARIQETPITLYLMCLAGNTVLTALVGAAVIYFSGMALALFGIGVGVIAYAGAVAFYTLLALLRMRAELLRQERRAARNQRASEHAMIETLKAARLAPALAPEENHGK
ncbi:MAG TPA: hypothetical protein VHH88_12870 [Verrucomicrobiae bacterium]|nr:hypothetical protein [Verrucomicrobiae bacterium]